MPHPDAPVNVPSSGLSITALGAWLVIQLVALLVACLQVPFWAHSPSPGDGIAIDMMLVTQITVVSLLFPLLLRNWRSMVCAVSTAGPFVVFAGLLAGTTHSQMSLAGVALGAWMIALWLCVPLLTSRQSALLGVCVASLIAIGGPLLLYFRLEAFPDELWEWRTASLDGPIMTALHAAHTSTSLHSLLYASGVALMIGFALRCIAWARRARGR